jgi:Ran GTPase-activating protein (RanGAP) involved in mRNA processing and transport
MDNIKIIRLQSGEDIIGNYNKDEHSGVIIVNRPMTLFFKRLSMNRTVMMMGPWLPVELIQDNLAELYTKDILTVISPKESMVSYYINAADDMETTLKENGSNIEASLTNYDQDDDDEEDDDEEDEEILEMLQTQTRGKTFH